MNDVCLFHTHIQIVPDFFRQIIIIYLIYIDFAKLVDFYRPTYYAALRNLLRDTTFKIIIILILFKSFI